MDHSEFDMGHKSGIQLGIRQRYKYVRAGVRVRWPESNQKSTQKSTQKSAQK